MADQPTANLTGQFPEEDDLKTFIERRKRGGFIWQTLFQAATIISIIALTALLYNIINSAFGYVVVQNKIDPLSLVLSTDEERMLSASNTISSEDDNELVKGISGNPNAIGFFGYAYYSQNTDQLRTLAIDGIEPSQATAESGDYPIARPLFIYTTAATLREKPQIAAFVTYYLSNLDSIVQEVGYFPVSAETGAESQQALLTALAADSLTTINPAEVPAEEIVIAGSSTVYPLSRQAAVQFRRDGFQGGLDLQLLGTTAGFRVFCEGDSDIANASRAINRAEAEICRSKKLEPLGFRVANDSLAVVVSQENEFLNNVTQAELRHILTSAETWSEVNPAWPNAPIERFIPGGDSGTLDFFTEVIFTRDLAELSAAELLVILENGVSAGRYRALDADYNLAESSQAQLYDLVLEDVVQQRVVRSWNLYDSLTKRDEIAAAAETVAQGELQFRSWLSWEFVSEPQSSTPDLAGIRTAIFGSLWVIVITICVALPIGVGAAIYLEEYAALVGNPILRRINGIIQTNINNLAGVPSIIYGMLGLAIFVRVLEPITSGTLFGLADPSTANGRTIISASLTLALLILPLIIINAQEAIRAVPQSLRQAGMGLGATRWQTIWAHVLPGALPGILTGNILAMSRAIGETAPLVVVGASTFITINPDSPFAKFTVLPIQIYQWTSRPQDEFRHIAAAAIIVLLILLLTLNASAVLLRNRYSRRLS